MQERINFTINALDKLSPDPSGRRRYVYDTRVNGLCLSVTPAGTKSFLVYRKLNGRPLRVTLGRYPDMKVEQARTAAKKRLGELADGRNPIEERRAARQRGLTLGEVFAVYLSDRGEKLSSNTISNYKTIMGSHLSDWSNKPMSEITRDKVEQRHRQLSLRSPTAANKTMRVLRALFNYAHGKYEDESGRGLFPDNPVTRLTHTKAWNKETRRQNKIKNLDLKPWYKAVLTLSDVEDSYGRTAGDYFQFLLLHGLRRREAASLKWTNIDFDEKVFTVENTKNGQPITLPMSDYTFFLLRNRYALSSSEYVFSSSVGTSCINDPRRQIAEVRERSGVHFTLHDLRRTFISIAESLDVSAYAVKKLVNHGTGGDVTAGYVVMDVERLRKPMQQITNFILKNAAIEPSTPVQELHPDSSVVK